jgi:hypothetical protein
MHKPILAAGRENQPQITQINADFSTTKTSAFVKTTADKLRHEEISHREHRENILPQRGTKGFFSHRGHRELLQQAVLQTA